MARLGLSGHPWKAHLSTGRPASGRSLLVRSNPAETLEADVQVTLKLSFTLHRLTTARVLESKGTVDQLLAGPISGIKFPLARNM